MLNLQNLGRSFYLKSNQAKGSILKKEDKPIYGITNNIKSFNPLVIASHEYINIWTDVKRADKFSVKLKYLFYPPGWSHSGENRTSKHLRSKLK